MSLRILENAPLAGLNTFGVSARARRLVVLDDERDLAQALEACAGFASRRVLGGGSNVLFTRDFEGALLLMRTRGCRVLDHEAGRSADLSAVSVQAGEPWDDLVRWTLAHELPGLENLSMIPGTCGAAAIQNIGAYGLELCERFESLRAVHLDTGESRVFDRQACAFGYRHSLFKTPDHDRWLVLELRLSLGPAHRPVLGYGELAAAFGTRAQVPSAQEVSQLVRATRARKLPDPALLGNAGSFFKNPVVSQARAEQLLASHPTMPSYRAGADAPAGHRKLSAGWLIDRCGWKGHREGDAGVHAAHALVLVNHGHASGAQIAALAERIRTSVHERFGVWLEPEPVIIDGL